MRLLLTGGAGFLGRNMLLALPPSWEVVALVRPQHATFAPFLECHRLSGVTHIACDLADERQVAHAFERAGSHFDACLYLAANTSIPGSIDDPLADLRDNTVGVLHTLRHALVDHFVFLSSGAVYVGLEGLVGPGSATAPTLPYAISKLAAERYVLAAALHHGTPRVATILRFFGAFGPYEPSRKIYTRLVRQFALNGDPSFVVTGDGQNYIDAMYVSDAVEALLRVLGAPPTHSQTLDLGVGGGITIDEIVQRAAHLFGVDPHITHVGQPPEYIRFFIDTQPFAQRYGFQPHTSLEQGLEALAAHLRGEDADALQQS